MSFANAQQSRIWVNSLAYSGYTTNFKTEDTTDMLRTTTLADASETYIPGEETGKGVFALLLDSDGSSAGQFGHSTGWKSAAEQPVTYMPLGVTQGAIAVMNSALQSEMSISATHDEAVKATLNCQFNTITEVGQVIADQTAITADTNGTTFDNAAATTNGGSAHLHVTAYSGLTSNSVIIEHSVDNSVWATLATFTLVTGKTSERITVAAGTTVRRYMRIRDDVTGTGSCTRGVVFCRR